MYIATLQAVKPDSHPELVKSKRGVSNNKNVALSEPKTGIALMCLALEHARNLGMQIAVLDATEASVSFYREIFGFVCMQPSEPRKYVPMMLHLRSFCPSIPLMSRSPNSLAVATRFPGDSEEASVTARSASETLSRDRSGGGSNKSKRTKSKGKGKFTSNRKGGNVPSQNLPRILTKAHIQLRLEKPTENCGVYGDAPKKKASSPASSARKRRSEAAPSDSSSGSSSSSSSDTNKRNRLDCEELGTRVDNDGVRFSTSAVSKSVPALALSVFCQCGGEGDNNDSQGDTNSDEEDMDEVLKDGSLMDAAEMLQANERRPRAVLGGSDAGASNQFVQIHLGGRAPRAQERRGAKRKQRKGTSTADAADGVIHANAHFVSCSVEHPTPEHGPESRTDWYLGQGFGQSPFRVRPRLKACSAGRLEPSALLAAPQPMLSLDGAIQGDEGGDTRSNLLPSDARAAEEWHDVDEIADAIREAHSELLELHSSRVDVS